MVTQILFVILVLIILYFLFAWMFKSSKTLTTLQEGNVKQVIHGNTLPGNKGTSSNYTYSMWVYVDDWNYRYGEEKVLLSSKDSDGNPIPSIVLGAMENNVTVSVTCYPVEKGGQDVVHDCVLRNIPLQKWVNILISLNGRTLDVYMDGKLVRTCLLPGIAKVQKSSNIEVTPNGGFKGWTSNIQYWADSTNPQQAYNIYREGYSGSGFLLSNIINKYRLKISFLEDNKVQGSFEL